MAVGGVTIWSGTPSAWSVAAGNSAERADIRRGADALYKQPTRSYASVTLRDDDGTYWATPPFSAGDWIRLSGTDDLGSERVLFVGKVTDTSDDHNELTGRMEQTITAVDELADLGASEVSTPAVTTAGQAPGARLGDILDEHGFTVASRSFSAGTQTLSSTPYTGVTALEDCRRVAASDAGVFFVDRLGTYVFLSDLMTSTPPASSITLYDTETGAPDVRYRGFRRRLGRDLVANFVTASAVEFDDPRYGLDPASQAANGVQEASYSSLLQDDVNDLQDWATVTAAWRGDMTSSFAVSVPWRDDWFRLVAATELFDVATVRRTLGGTTVTEDCWIIGFGYRWDPHGFWQSTLELEPIPTVTTGNWTLDNSSFNLAAATELNGPESKLT